MRLRSLHRAYPSLHPSGVVHWVPEQLHIKAVTGACKLIDGCSLALCSATVLVVSAGICHRNEVNSIAWLYRRAQPKDSIHYITLHYIALHYITLHHIRRRNMIDWTARTQYVILPGAFINIPKIRHSRMKNRSREGIILLSSCSTSSQSHCSTLQRQK